MELKSDAPRNTRDKAQLILDAAARVFGRNGYHGSTVADIAREAGVAAGTIYLYFERKEQTLGALFRRLLEPYLEASRHELGQMESSSDKLRRLVELHFGFFERDADLARVFQLHLREVTPAIRDEIRPALRLYMQVIEGLVESGLERGEFRRGTDIRAARHVIFGTLDAAVTAWVLSRHDYSLSDSAESIADLLVRALQDPQTGVPTAP